MPYDLAKTKWFFKKLERNLSAPHPEGSYFHRSQNPNKQSQAWLVLRRKNSNSSLMYSKKNLGPCHHQYWAGVKSVLPVHTLELSCPINKLQSSVLRTEVPTLLEAVCLSQREGWSQLTSHSSIDREQRAWLSGSCLYGRRPDGDSLVERSLLWFPEFLSSNSFKPSPSFFSFSKRSSFGASEIANPHDLSSVPKAHHTVGEPTETGAWFVKQDGHFP